MKKPLASRVRKPASPKVKYRASAPSGGESFEHGVVLSSTTDGLLRYDGRYITVEQSDVIDFRPIGRRHYLRRREVEESAKTILSSRQPTTKRHSKPPVLESHDFVKLDLGDPLSEEILRATSTAVVPEPEKDAESYVLEFVEKRHKIAPEWKPEESLLGDGERTFADYWNEEPRNYEALRQLIERHLARIS